jgi:hypothetical protein
MRKAIQNYFAVLLGIAFAVWVVGTSPSYQTCKAEQAAWIAKQQKENPPPFLLTATDSAAAYARCLADVVHKYRDAIATLATLLIAIFTLTIKRATDRQLKFAEKQRIDSLRFIEATGTAAQAAMLSARSAIALQFNDTS